MNGKKIITGEILGKRLLVLIPAYNEEEIIGATLKELLAFNMKTINVEIDICVVDDGSTDKTALIAQESGVRVIQLHSNLGVGGAVRCGLQFALAQDYDLMLQYDADGQHSPTEIQKMIAHSEFVDIVIGSRFSEKSEYKMGIIRSSMRIVIAKLLWLACGKHVKDPTSGFRLYNKKAINVLARSYPTRYLEDSVLTLYIASRAKLDINEISVKMRSRLGGEPSQSISSLVQMSIMLVITLIAGLNRKDGSL
jgi:glycosyltransferase involved in cell wall biosynthesis